MREVLFYGEREGDTGLGVCVRVMCASAEIKRKGAKTQSSKEICS